jgi:hypothetical protein
MSTSRTASAGQPLLGRLETLTVLAVVGVVALVVGIAGLAAPASRTVVRKVPFTHTGSYSYSASAARTSPYGAAGLSTGEPILTGLVGPVDMGFAYALDSHVPAAVHGTASMSVHVDAGSGLSRDFAVAAPTSFSDSHVKISGKLPVPAITSYLAATNRALGSPGGSQVATITVESRIRVIGTVGGRPVDSTFAPPLPFTYNGSSLTLSRSATAPDTDTQALLKPAESMSASYSSHESGSVPLGVTHLPRSIALTVGFGLALLCLWLGLFIGRSLVRKPNGENEPARIRALYGSQLLPVRSLARADGPVAEVGSMSALADLAKEYESRIMHIAEAQRDSYLVWDNGMLYRYTVGEPAALSAEGHSTGNERLVVLPFVVASDDAAEMQL